jgi:hypothetical protein
MLALGITYGQRKQSSRQRQQPEKEENKMKMRFSHSLLVAAIFIAGFAFAGCDSEVMGNTYVDSAGAFSIEFRPSGKANVKFAGLTLPCTYVRSGKNITVTCNGVSQVLTMNSDGSLGDPAAGVVGKLTRKTN